MTRLRIAVGAAGLALVLFTGSGRAADHLDSLNLTTLPEADINDLYAWTTNDDDLVIALSVNRFSDVAGLGGNTEFSSEVLYSFNIDNDGDPSTAEHRIDIQFSERADEETDPATHIQITGLPGLGAGGSTVLELDANGMVTQGDVDVFAGPREDPFFFDLVWFLDVADDHPLAAVLNDDRDFYHNRWGATAELHNDDSADTFLAHNVSMIVIQFPAADVTGDDGVLGIWASTGM